MASPRRPQILPAPLRVAAPSRRRTIGLADFFLDRKQTPPKIRNDYRWILGLLVFGCGLGTLGCNPTAPETKNPSSSNASAPPLKLILVDSAPLEAELALRWQTVSEQKLAIENKSREALRQEDVSPVDVIVYPADFVGTLVDRGWITSIPASILYNERETQPVGDASTKSDGVRSPVSAQWAPRWRSVALYGGKTMGVPLGAPCWLAIQRELDISPLLKLHQAIGSNQNTSSQCEALWNAFLEKGESQLADKLAGHRAQLAEMLTKVTPESKRHLVARYLWMMSTTESRFRGMFDLFTLQSRLNQPEFARTARHLHRLAVLEPQTILADPVTAWESVAEGKARFGIGWPRSDSQQRLDASDPKQSSVLPIAWNGADGLIVSMGKRTRQSANATALIQWLIAEEQRLALQALTPRAEPLEIDDDRNVIREDYREYQTTQRLEAANLSMELTPRFVGAERWVELLGDALVDILRAPDTAESRLAECKKQCDALVETIGKERVRTSLEAASGYSKSNENRLSEGP